MGFKKFSKRSVVKMQKMYFRFQLEAMQPTTRELQQIADHIGCTLYMIKKLNEGRAVLSDFTSEQRLKLRNLLKIPHLSDIFPELRELP